LIREPAEVQQAVVRRVRDDGQKPVQAWREETAARIRRDVTLPDAKYRVIYADPPWSYNDKADEGAIQAAGADAHYPTMSIAELCALPIAELCEPNAALFLWTTSPLLLQNPGPREVIEAWGFAYKASFVWDKVAHNMGHYNSVRHEVLLLCTSGSCVPDTHELFDSVQSIERTAHSTKPEEFREIIDALYPYGKRIELFARAKLPQGWDGWGYEARLAGRIPAENVPDRRA
jgi:N6-adenosine-specific RNA methylase IME4